MLPARPCNEGETRVFIPYSPREHRTRLSEGVRVQEAEFVRLVARDDGESHFEDVQMTLLPVDFAPPAAPLNVAAIAGAERCSFVGAFPDWHGEESHPSPYRQFFCTMSGTYEITASDGEKRQFPTGSLLLLEDTSGKGHSTRVISEDDVLILAVVLK